ncbi:hypothetical protein GCK72_020766 [Caenorhabditis remanei]|uniref:CUB-like domain-containing protein n=1 Tax=Caenorhabditis remanei TaxID=31234 RepID=A0A6A5GHR6_CAERE|nr:hypothetical protein GCK72_020766 [Caenorhabditis remanei]KAF1754206.1 hypothetical protein GCK72_020766 [Caenorhabditis remanei]
MFRVQLLVSISALIAVCAAGNVCKTGNIVNRLVNSRPYYWPATWTENRTAPHLEEDQSCSWTVTVPKGYYAKLIISGKANDKNSSFQMIDAAGNLIQTTHEEMEPYYFPPYKFTLAVSTKAVASFAFKIEWFLLPQVQGSVQVSATTRLINATSSTYCESYGGNGGVSLLLFPDNRTHYYSLRSVLVFLGHDLDGNYVSNLYLLHQTHKQWISNVDITIVNLEASGNGDLLLIQEAEKIKDVTYTELVPMPGFFVTVTIDSRVKKSALIIGYQVNQTLVDVKMDDPSSTVSIYYGSPSPFTLDKTYNQTTFNNVLPLEFDNYGMGVIEFFVNAGKAVFTFEYQ